MQKKNKIYNQIDNVYKKDIFQTTFFYKLYNNKKDILNKNLKNKC